MLFPFGVDGTLEGLPKSLKGLRDDGGTRHPLRMPYFFWVGGIGTGTLRFP